MSAVAIAGAMVMAMGVTAFAADMNGESGKIGEFTNAENVAVQDNQVVIYKEITAVNPTSSKVYAPAVSYSYTIAPGSAGKSITDSQNVKALTKAGLEGATITESVAWTTADADKLNASAAGVANRKPITVDFSGVAWTGAGVYRYEITETEPDYDASSIIEGNENHKRYLDVYVKDKAESGYEIYGYVCFASDEDITKDTADKTEGFVDSDTTAASNADQYYTYDLTVTKTVVNDRANETHRFPFAVTFTPGTGVTAANFKLDTAVTNAELGANYQGALTADAPKIQHTGSVKYVGIPYGTKVDVVEKVDVNGTIYKVTSEGADTNVNQNITGTAEGAASNPAVVNAQATASLASKTTAFTNTLELISPTGVIMRFAPFLLILAGGIVLLVLSRRRRAA